MQEPDPKQSTLSSSVSGIPARPSRLPTRRLQTSTTTPTPSPPTSRLGPPKPSGLKSPISPASPRSAPSFPPISISVSNGKNPTSSTSVSRRTSVQSLRSQKSESTLRTPVTPKPSSFVPPPVPVTSLRARASNSSLKPLVLSASASTPTSTRRAPGISTTHSTPTKKSSTTNLRRSAPKSPASPNQEVGEQSSRTLAALNIKEQIAARRAAMKKPSASGASSSLSASTSASGPGSSTPSFGPGSGSRISDWNSVRPEDTPNSSKLSHAGIEDDLLGRPSVNAVIVKALSTGGVNLLSRQLTALPDALFQLHLGIKPKSLTSRPNDLHNEDSLPDISNRWEAMDLLVLKAGDNEIEELQDEIGLFGALKTIDFQRNKLSVLPTSFMDLICLTHLDLSHCKFQHIPPILGMLPALITLNLSHNAITALEFHLPAEEVTAQKRRESDFYRLSAQQNKGKPEVPFPALQTLLLSHNQIVATEFLPDEAAARLAGFPQRLAKVDLNKNPLGANVSSLLTLLGGLPGLKEVHMRLCGAGALNDFTLSSSFQALSSSLPSPLFCALDILDLGDNEGLSDDCVRRTLLAFRIASSHEDMIAVGSHIDQLMARVPPTSSNAGILRLVIGKHIIKEAWEIEADRRALSKSLRGRPVELDDQVDDMSAPTFGRKEVRVRRTGFGIKDMGKVSVFEGWEESSQTVIPDQRSAHSRASTPSASASAGQSEIKADMRDHEPSVRLPPLDKYYDEKARTLTLPSALPAGHQRPGVSSLRNQQPSDEPDPLVPRNTLPYAVIMAHPWAATLRVLKLSNRRVDPSFLLSSTENGIMPLDGVEELALDGCQLPSDVLTSYIDAVHSNPAAGMDSRQSESLLPLIARTFPSLVHLDLNYNTLTTLDGVQDLFFPPSLSPPSSPGGATKGLKVLRVRGNKLNEAGLVDLVRAGERFRTDEHKAKATWRGGEVDLRENEIGKLPGMLGMLPLDILLVEGNVFRVPNRRVWEREGTRGLLTWLRDSVP